MDKGKEYAPPAKTSFPVILSMTFHVVSPGLPSVCRARRKSSVHTVS